MNKNDIGLIGLAVMGQNLALNIARNGYGITVFNRTEAVTREFMDRTGTQAGITSAGDLEAFVASLCRPRKIICMVKAGPPVDAVIEPLAGLLEPGDLITVWRPPRFRLPWPIMTLTARPGCRRTCSRPNGIISGPTPTGARTKREYSIHNGSSMRRIPYSKKQREKR